MLKNGICYRFLWAIVLFSGCAGIHVEELPADMQASRMSPNEKTKDGLVVFCKPMTNPEHVVSFFGDDLLGYNFLPIRIFLENHTNKDNTEFTFIPSKTELTFEDGRRYTAVSSDKIFEEISFSYWRAVPYYFLAVIPGFFVAGSVTEANDDLQDSFREKSLGNITLIPGASENGKTIFLWPGEEEDLNLHDLENADLHLFFELKTSTETKSVSVVFHLFKAK